MVVSFIAATPVVLHRYVVALENAPISVRASTLSVEKELSAWAKVGSLLDFLRRCLTS